jgi:uncharacterized membrane protein
MESFRFTGIDLKPSRLETLSDGVLAIAMTILVIDLGTPVVPKLLAQDQLYSKLIEMWPKFAVYGLSFLVLGIFWFFHHFLFHYIKRSDGRFVWINILFLMFVALISFSTELIGEYSIYSNIAVALYGANGFIIMLILNVLWWYATKNRRLVNKDINPWEVIQVRLRFLIAAIFAAIAVGLSFINPYFGIFIYILVIIWAIVDTLTAKPYHESQGKNFLNK